MPSHADVARRIATYVTEFQKDTTARLLPIRTLRGSRMFVCGADMHLRDRMRHNSAGAFTPVGIGVSYSTYVVMLVHNSLSPTPSTPFELWVNPNLYSVTTQRHIGMFTSAFRSAMGYPDETPIYRTEAVLLAQGSRYTDRADPLLHNNVLDAALAQLRMVNKPYLHEHTRRMHIANAHNTLRTAINHMTQAYPVTEDPDPKRAIHRHTLVTEMQTLCSFIAALDTPDSAPTPIETIRLQIRAYLSLAKE